MDKDEQIIFGFGLFIGAAAAIAVKNIAEICYMMKKIRCGEIDDVSNESDNSEGTTRKDSEEAQMDSNAHPVSE